MMMMKVPQMIDALYAAHCRIAELRRGGKPTQAAREEARRLDDALAQLLPPGSKAVSRSGIKARWKEGAGAGEFKISTTKPDPQKQGKPYVGRGPFRTTTRQIRAYLKSLKKTEKPG